jgi:hypothetical protein
MRLWHWMLRYLPFVILAAAALVAAQHVRSYW